MTTLLIRTPDGEVVEAPELVDALAQVLGALEDLQRDRRPLQQRLEHAAIRATQLARDLGVLEVQPRDRAASSSAAQFEAVMAAYRVSNDDRPGLDEARKEALRSIVWGRLVPNDGTFRALCTAIGFADLAACPRDLAEVIDIDVLRRARRGEP